MKNNIVVLLIISIILLIVAVYVYNKQEQYQVGSNLNRLTRLTSIFTANVPGYAGAPSTSITPRKVTVTPGLQGGSMQIRTSEPQ